MSRMDQRIPGWGKDPSRTQDVVGKANREKDSYLLYIYIVYANQPTDTFRLKHSSPISKQRSNISLIYAAAGAPAKTNNVTLNY